MDIKDAAAEYRPEITLHTREDNVPPGYKRTEVGVIPEDWEVKPLGAALTIRHGKSQHAVSDENGPYPILATGGQIGTANKFLYNKPSVLIGRKGTINKPQFMSVPFWTVDTLFYSEISDFNDARFLYYLFLRIDWSQYNEASGVPSLNARTIESIDVQIPHFDEQRAIAEALSDADALIAALQRLIDKKRAIKQGTMQALLTGRQRLPGFTGEWETKTLGDVATLHRNTETPKNAGNQPFQHFSLPAFDAGKVPFIELGSLIGSNKFRVTPNAILLSKLNPRIPRVWMPREITEHAICSTEFLVLVPKQNISRHYLYTICTSSNFVAKMELAATGTTGSHHRVNPSDALELAIRIPLGLEEQTAIVAVLSDMDAEIEALETRLAKTRRLKAGMMQQLLTGRIRLVEPQGVVYV